MTTQPTETPAPASEELTAELTSSAALLSELQTVLGDIHRDAETLSPEVVAESLARVAGMLHDHTVNVLAPLVNLTRANLAHQTAGGQE